MGKKRKIKLMIVSNWDQIEDPPHKAGKFTHQAITNMHPFFLQRGPFQRDRITCSHVYDDYTAL